MLQIRKSEERGHANHGWLESYHTFSFGGYRDPQHMGFRVLRVINEDKVLADNGFGTHPHDNMEIISYVVSGELEHKDSMGNGSVIKAGEFQIISAGTGITHSEFNPSKDKATHFYQMWIMPEEKGLSPRYAQKSFESISNESSNIRLVASKSEEDGSLPINQDVKLYKIGIKEGEKVDIPLSKERHGWIQLIMGHIKVADYKLKTGDGVAISESEKPSVIALKKSELLFFDLP